MLDFRSRRRRTPNFTGAREQRQLLFLVLSAGIVLIALAESGAGGAWGWFQRIAGQDDEAAPEATADQVATARRTLPGLDGELFANVRDDTPLRDNDRPALDQLMATLAATSDEAISQASTGVLIYRQVYHQPQRYRGEAMKIVGVARRAQRLSAKQAENGNSTRATDDVAADPSGDFWQLWVFPQGGDEPLVVYCRDVPEGFPEGLEIAERVEFQGVFFKRLAYPGQDRVRTAPMLAAKTVVWKRPQARPVPEARRLSVRDFVYSALGTILIGLAVVAYVVWRTEKMRKGRKERRRDDPVSFQERLATELHLRSLEGNPPPLVPAPGDVVLDDDDSAEDGAHA